MSPHFFETIPRQEEEFYESDDTQEPKRWYESLFGQIALCMGLAVCLVLLGLLLMPENYHRRHINSINSEHGFYGDIHHLQDSDVHDLRNKTTFGAYLRPWELDTSREYYLSRNGLWDTNQPPQTREYVFEVSDILAAPDGVEKQMTVVNGKFPGPLIEANEGDRIVVKLVNKGKRPTSLHFHGLHQNGTNYMDGAHGINQCAIAPGKSFTYDFNLTQYGTYWYHAHYSTQMMDGVAGPVVIHSKQEEIYKYDEEMLIFMSDLYHKDTIDLVREYIAPNVENAEPVPDSGLIQGTVKRDCSTVRGNYHCGSSRNAVIPVKRGKTYRFRLVSAGGFSEFDYSIDNHTMRVIETDGTSTEPLDVHVLRLSNAQRYSVLVDTNQQGGQFWMRATMNKICYDGDSSHLESDLKAVMAYPDEAVKILSNGGEVRDEPTSPKHKDLDGGTPSCVELDASLLIPKFPEVIPDPTQFIQLDASFQIGARQITLGYFNESSYKPPMDPTQNTLKSVLADSSIAADLEFTPKWADKRLVVTVPERQVVDLLVNNYDDGAHPFHMHGHKFWVLDGGKGYFDWEKYRDMNVTRAIKRDTFQVDKFGWALVRTVFDNPGVWPFHCHIAWHIASGMMMEFVTLPRELSKQRPPKEWYEICQVSRTRSRS